VPCLSASACAGLHKSDIDALQAGGGLFGFGSDSAGARSSSAASFSAIDIGYGAVGGGGGSDVPRDESGAVGRDPPRVNLPMLPLTPKDLSVARSLLNHPFLCERDPSAESTAAAAAAGTGAVPKVPASSERESERERERYRAEVSAMVSLGLKAELQALHAFGLDFLARCKLPTKLVRGLYI
jgi:hypothetical protein